MLLVSTIASTGVVARHGWFEASNVGDAMEAYHCFVGIDWGSQEHAVCVLDPHREVLGERSFEHEGAALRALVDWLNRLSDGHPDRVAVSIETPRSAVVDTLIDRGFHVYSLNPKQLDRFRDRHTVAGAKDDRRDAFVLADSLRTDRHLFRHLQPDRAEVVGIRELLRIDEDLRLEENRLANRVREQLHRYYPQLLSLCAAANEPWLWAVWEAGPTPAAGARLRPKKVGEILKAHRIRRVTADEVVAALRATPVHVAPGVAEAGATHVRYAVERLRLVHRQHQEVGKRIDAAVEAFSEGNEREHRDAHLLLTLTGAGNKVVGTMLAEASSALAERDYSALRALAGVAPVTQSSGKRSKTHPRVVMRQACNGRLRNALYHWARVAVQHDPMAKEQYAELRRRRHSHGRALRSVADRQLRIAFAMLRTGTEYDPSKPRRARKLEVAAA